MHPNYSKLIKYLQVTDQLENDGIQDHLEEIVLNEFVQVITENHPTLDKDKVVDTVYDGIRKILDHFIYYNNNSISDGFSFALYEIKERDPKLYEEIVKEINETIQTKVEEDIILDV